MPQHVQLHADLRSSRGKGPTRRLRRTGLIPGVIYGPDITATPIQLDPKPVVRLIRQGSAENTLIDLQTTDGNQWLCLLKSIQLDPVSNDLQHVDFYAVQEGVTLSVRIPVLLQGTAPGIKEGGILEFQLRELEVECLPKDIPSCFNVDLSSLAIGDSIKISDLDIGKEIRIVEEPDAVIVSIAAAKAEVEEAEPEAALGFEPEPEVIPKGKPTEEED